MAENFLLEAGRLVYAKAHVVGGRSGAMAGLGSGVDVFALRVPTGAEPLILSQIDMACWTETPFTAAQMVAFTIYKATAFTTSQSGGVNLTPFRKRTTDTTVLASTEFEAKIANAASLSGGTRTLDLNAPLGAMATTVQAVAAAGHNSGSYIWTPKNNIPIALEPNEGIVIVSEIALAAGGAVRLVVAADVHKA